jgi:hypothetical protein
MSDKEQEMLSRAARELLAEGEARGEARGETKALTRVLERRFKPLPAHVLRPIWSAGSGELEAWLDRSVEAPSLDAVFCVPEEH